MRGLYARAETRWYEGCRDRACRSSAGWGGSRELGGCRAAALVVADAAAPSSRVLGLALWILLFPVLTVKLSDADLGHRCRI